MRILVVGDLHGQVPEMPEGDFDLVIAPGDICGDKGIRDCIWRAYQKFLDGDEDARWWDECASEDKARQLLNQSVAQGRAVAERLASRGVPVVIVPGNWDWTGEDEFFGGDKDFFHEDVLEGLDITDIDGHVLRLGEVTLIGYGNVNGPELAEYRGYALSDEELAEDREEYALLQEAYDELFHDAEQPIIFLTHNVPYGTTLDVIENPESPKDGEHYGSNLARYLCETHQPLLCIGGHIHEHHGTDEIGKTTCLNTGFGPEVHTIIEIKDGRLVKLELHEVA